MNYKAQKTHTNKRKECKRAKEKNRAKNDEKKTVKKSKKKNTDIAESREMEE